MPFYKVCLLNQLSTEKPIKFSVDGLEILFVKSVHSETVWAFDNNCNHSDKPLEKGRWNAETAEITCPFHKAVFCIAENGAVKAPPACAPLPVYQTEIRIEAENAFVYVFLD